MILTGKQIVSEVKKGIITIDPFCIENVNPNSYNYRIGTIIKESVGHNQFIEHPISKAGFHMKPHILYLSNTKETIGSVKFSASLIGRSSLGRLGLFLQHSANLGHVGAIHSWTLELMTVKPFIIYPNMLIGQVSFWANFGKVNKYNGFYGFKSGIVENNNYGK